MTPLAQQSCKTVLLTTHNKWLFLHPPQRCVDFYMVDFLRIYYLLHIIDEVKSSNFNLNICITNICVFSTSPQKKKLVILDHFWAIFLSKCKITTLLTIYQPVFHRMYLIGCAGQPPVCVQCVAASCCGHSCHSISLLNGLMDGALL